MIIKYLLNKYLTAIIISLSTILFIFFVFSLIGNLNSIYNFKSVIILSTISTLQILFYIPLLIFFIITLTFSIILKNNNELIIIMHYLSLKKIIKIFLLIIIFFSFLEINKKIIIDYLEQIKIDKINQKTKYKNIVILKQNNYEKEYILIKRENNDIESLNLYNIKNNKINYSIFSSNLIENKNEIITNEFYELSGNKIKKKYEYKILFSYFDNSFFKNNINYLINSKDIKLDAILIYKFLILALSFNIILITFFEKKYLFFKSYPINFYLFSLFIILYTYTITSYDLNYFQTEFKILSVLFLVFSMVKKFKYD